MPIRMRPNASAVATTPAETLDPVVLLPAAGALGRVTLRGEWEVDDSSTSLASVGARLLEKNRRLCAQELAAHERDAQLARLTEQLRQCRQELHARTLERDNRELAAEAYRLWGFGDLSQELIDVLNRWARFVYGPLLDDRARMIQERAKPGSDGWGATLYLLAGPKSIVSLESFGHHSQTQTPKRTIRA